MPYGMLSSCAGEEGTTCRYSCENGLVPAGNRTCGQSGKHVFVYSGGSCVTSEDPVTAVAGPAEMMPVPVDGSENLNLLRYGDICDRLCDDGAYSRISRKQDCPLGTVCMATGVDNCEHPHTCQRRGDYTGPVSDVSYVHPVVVQMSTDSLDPRAAQYDTYQLGLSFASADVKNVYAIFGSPAVTSGKHAGKRGESMLMPAAYQAPAPFGTNVGGTNPQLWELQPSLSYDSWLTVGSVQWEAGATATQISTVGIDFDGWTETQQLSVTNGAVFWLDPNVGSTQDPTVVAQISVPRGGAPTWTAVINARGKRAGYNGRGGDDWEASGLVFEGGNAYAGKGSGVWAGSGAGGH